MSTQQATATLQSAKTDVTNPLVIALLTREDYQAILAKARANNKLPHVMMSLEGQGLFYVLQGYEPEKQKMPRYRKDSREVSILDFDVIGGMTLRDISPLVEVPSMLEKVIHAVEPVFETSASVEAMPDDDFFYPANARAQEWAEYEFKVGSLETTARELFNALPHMLTERNRLFRKRHGYDKPDSAATNIFRLLRDGVIERKEAPSNDVDITLREAGIGKRIRKAIGRYITPEEALRQAYPQADLMKELRDQLYLVVGNARYDATLGRLVPTTVYLDTYPNASQPVKQLVEDLNTQIDRYSANDDRSYFTYNPTDNTLELTMQVNLTRLEGLAQLGSKYRNATLRIKNKVDEYKPTDKKLNLVVVALMKQEVGHLNPGYFTGVD